MAALAASSIRGRHSLDTATMALPGVTVSATSSANASRTSLPVNPQGASGLCASDPNSRKTSAPSVTTGGGSRRTSSNKNSLTVPPTGGGPRNSFSGISTTLELPYGDSLPPNFGQRRCSARLLSLNVREALKQLRQREHKARVASVVQRNADYYRRQRLCECITMMSLLTLFSLFSLYIVFAYGFHLGKAKPFNLIDNGMDKRMLRSESTTVELWCQADAYWEWCRWIHHDRYCDFEWISNYRGVVADSCDFPFGKVELIGNYEEHQCGIRISDLSPEDRGLWLCEIEKYYRGFSRRYGEVLTSSFTLVVASRNGTQHQKKFSEPQHSPVSTTARPPSDQVDFSSEADMDEERHEGVVEEYEHGLAVNTTVNPLAEIEEYRRRFFLLKVFVLGGIGIVMGSLLLVFWGYFTYLWRTMDSSKRPDAVTFGEYGDFDPLRPFIGDVEEHLILKEPKAGKGKKNRRKSSISVVVKAPPEENGATEVVELNGAHTQAKEAAAVFTGPGRRESYLLSFGDDGSRRLSVASEDARRMMEDRQRAAESLPSQDGGMMMTNGNGHSHGTVNTSSSKETTI